MTEPIAIVGRGCVLPGALSPDQFWDNIKKGQINLDAVRPEEWRMPPGSLPAGTTAGLVRGFADVFDPDGFTAEAGAVTAYDPALQWVLHAGRTALREAGEHASPARTGLILGNLGYPSRSLAAYAERIWLDGHPGGLDPRSRFCSGLWAHTAANALGLTGGSFALDAACASALYAIKIACDRLHDGRADLMLAGAVSGCDGLIIDSGFAALGALSPSGRSRPLQRGADGLIPAEGAALLAFMRLPDAVAAHVPVLGVIRGIGLSNDGRTGGFLVPAEGGQIRAMDAAYRAAGFTPDTVELLECHATGTPVGDAVEARSTARFFGDRPAPLPIGSAKSNVGHLLTASGAAGLLKLLSAIEHGTLPATAGATDPIDDLRDAPLRLLQSSEPWPSGRRRAAISAFGFGGNNAHLIVEAYDDHPATSIAMPSAPTPAPNSAPDSASDPDPTPATDLDPASDSAPDPDPGLGSDPASDLVSDPAPDSAEAAIAIVAIGTRVGDVDAGGLRDAVLSGRVPGEAPDTVEVALDDLRYPPRDLGETLGQQLLVLEAAREAVRGIALPPERTAVLMGMGCDPEIARAHARRRLEAAGQAGDEFSPALTAARVLGAMANIVANRIGGQLGLSGPGFAVSAEEASGIMALELAARALRTGEIDAALVGAVDLADEPVHRTALAQLGRTAKPTDAAIVLVLKRHDDAQRDGDPIIALLDRDAQSNRDGDDDAQHNQSAQPARGARNDRDAQHNRGAQSDRDALNDRDAQGDWHGLVDGETLGADAGWLLPSGLFGLPHAAVGLLDVAVAALALRHRVRPRAGLPARPDLGATTVDVVTSVLGAAPVRVRLRAGDAAPWAPGPLARLHLYSGADRAGVLVAARDGVESDTGPARLAVLARDSGHLADQLARARAWLGGEALRPAGVAFRESPIGGETAFVYPMSSSFYPGMGADLALAFAPIAAAADGASLVSWLYKAQTERPEPLDEILAVGFLSGLQTRISRTVLGIEPQAAIGYSSGESAALVALGAWTDGAAMAADARADGLFTHDLSGELRAVRRFWERRGIDGERWIGYLLAADPEVVRAMVKDEPAVHLSAVCAPGACVVSGEERACTAFAEGFERIRLQLLVAHVPEVAEVRDRWHALHRRPTAGVPGVRFYRGATGDWYHPTEESAADAITEQMLAPVNFPNLIERAWQDGVRVFIEHGPAAQCTGWIRRILGDREHVAVALDAVPGQGLWSLSVAVAELAAAGVPVRPDALAAYFATPAPAGPGAGITIDLPKRLPAPVLTEPAGEYEVMAPAPDLTRMPASAAPAAQTVHEVDEAAQAVDEIAAPAPARSPEPAASPALAWYAAITAAHHQYLELQAAAHRQFLSGRSAAVAAITPAANPTAAIAPAASPIAAITPVDDGWPGPKFGRAQLEHLASGRISEVFGPVFAAQDDDVRQTRMPRPPLLLADRVLGIDAAPGAMGTGVIWTETDVQADSWYLDQAGRMPAGLVVEAGQADLLLISWLGADLHNRGERVYRLLGSDVTFHGPPPGPGQTLRFEIRIVRHVAHGPIRLFFFEYDCHVGDALLLTVRDGQAGFFTDEELSRTGGVLWEAKADRPAGAVRSFDAAAVAAFAEGRPDECFGPKWAVTRAHVRTPRIGSGRLRLLDEVPVLDPAGYLRAETAVRPDDWFFDGHFHNDPCMPGTLMSEGCLQAVSFYLAAAGHTIDRDGWRFEPVPGRVARMRCRGQVTPDSRRLTYEVFVTEMSADPFPTVVADVLVTVDGVKALHVADCAVRLVPDWPLEHWRHLGPPTVQQTEQPVPLPALGGLAGHHETQPVAWIGDLPLGYASLLACAWGRPTDGLGPMAEAFTGSRRGPRLPGPPYHFISRIVAVDGPYQGMAVGSAVVAEYDVPDEAWFFEGAAAALMEIALQPCGWLGCYVGSPVQIDAELLFRNLDGDLRVHRAVRPANRVVRTRAEITNISRAAGMIIETFRIECQVDGELLLSGTAVFGYFLTTAFAQQPGLPPTAAEREPVTEVRENPPAMGPMLTMLDRITGYSPAGGAAGLGRLRAEKDIDPGDWYFKAHFFQDPVMPGSLGVEAMTQLLRWYLGEPVALETALTWTYRGQVVPTDRLLTVEVEILEIKDRSVYARGWLWIDGRRIYRVDRLGVRLDGQ
ncbi:acyl transferase domain-containing protein/3-hydroxymyristoyl/3-hydroxydecanoyl-(acyl carrier protein) dehydratase [Actinoplanes tereljensis]|uniref:Type I polyketide synthase n=1 Tax=Paractinoplanes tereljensis TaxID=571912 RepID=A0A919NTS0_9ACTN|nr:beta-ketoacyl synthase N-terminal-like domain-containing protein [Actinoplanes tereljensis]GIF23627.1 type I polyketide synthase [Actinoplanes tereljensis]